MHLELCPYTLLDRVGNTFAKTLGAGQNYGLGIFLNIFSHGIAMRLLRERANAEAARALIAVSMRTRDRGRVVSESSTGAGRGAQRFGRCNCGLGAPAARAHGAGTIHATTKGVCAEVRPVGVAADCDAVRLTPFHRH